jgi:hypothetical protein
MQCPAPPPSSLAVDRSVGVVDDERPSRSTPDDPAPTTPRSPTFVKGPIDREPSVADACVDGA